MKKLFSFFILLSCECFAQNESNIWYFGAQAGVDFNSGAPVALANCSFSFNAFEGVGTVCDTTGKLLFYTDGNHVINANHVVMSNGNGLKSNVSSTQTGLSVKQPGNDSLYYIFHIDLLNPIKIFYSIVDMSLNGGLGDVIQKNVLLKKGVTEKATAVAHANGVDVWIIIHESNSTAFNSFLLTSAGLNTTPVVSNVGPVYTSDIGYLKASPQGDKLASADFYMNSYSLFDFDNSTGVVSNMSQSPPNYMYAYGCEWSPDGTKLYGGRESSNELWQFDVSAGPNVWNTATLIYLTSSQEFEALQLGPDGKIYCSRYQTAFLGVINDPDSLGAACNYVENGVDLLGRVCYLGLPNYNASIFKKANLLTSNLASSDSSVCENTCIDFYDVSKGSPTSWQWSFPGANPSSSVLKNPTGICYSTSGTYDVTLIVTNSAGSDTIVMSNFITVNTTPNATITQSNDTLFTITGNSYQWYTGGNAINGATDYFYMPSAEGYYSVVVNNANGCSATDTIFFSLSPQTSFAASDTTICQKFCMDFFDQSGNNPTTWQWSFPGGIPSSSTQQNPTQICYNNTGVYDVTLITTNYYGSDTLVLTGYITVYATPAFPTITVTGDVLTSSYASSYQWQFNSVDIPGATNQSYTATQTGYYTVVITNENGCVSSATVYVEVTGISGLITANGVFVYPNPSNGLLEIEWMQDGTPSTVSITLVNALGQKLLSSDQAYANKAELDLRSFADGVYFIDIKTESESIRKKILLLR